MTAIDHEELRRATGAPLTRRQPDARTRRPVVRPDRQRYPLWLGRPGSGIRCRQPGVDARRSVDGAGQEPRQTSQRVLL